MKEESIDQKQSRVTVSDSVSAFDVSCESMRSVLTAQKETCEMFMLSHVTKRLFKISKNLYQ